jgi:hypothetical protein
LVNSMHVLETAKQTPALSWIFWPKKFPFDFLWRFKTFNFILIYHILIMRQFCCDKSIRAYSVPRISSPPPLYFQYFPSPSFKQCLEGFIMLSSYVYMQAYSHPFPLPPCHWSLPDSSPYTIISHHYHHFKFRFNRWTRTYLAFWVCLVSLSMMIPFPSIFLQIT